MAQHGGSTTVGVDTVGRVLSAEVDPTTITLAIIAFLTAIATPTIASIINAHTTARAREADWARQDQVAAAAEAAANRLVESQHTLAQAALKAAVASEHRGRAVAARLDQLDDKAAVIHDLVNSSMTAAMQSEYEAVVRDLRSQRQLLELYKAQGVEPSTETLDMIAAIAAKADELHLTLENRKRAQAASEELIAAQNEAAGIAPATMSVSGTVTRDKPVLPARVVEVPTLDIDELVAPEIERLIPPGEH